MRTGHYPKRRELARNHNGASMEIVLPTPVSPVAKRWGRVFTIFLVLSTIATWLTTAVAIGRGERVPDDLWLASLLMVAIIPLNLMLLIPPMFFGGYPAWIVRLFGERFLQQMITGLFAAPSQRAGQKQHGKYDAMVKQRYALALLVLLAILAGLVTAFG